MADQFIAEIRIFSFGFPPRGWALCNGQLLSINQNQPLFALLGTKYGGDGRTTFGLPNLMGRAPMYTGNGHALGELGGEANHTLSVTEMPAHIHSINASTKSDSTNGDNPVGSVLAGASNLYGAAGNTTMISATLANAGGSVGHLNMQPFLTLSFCISLTGIFPSQN
jgi:microcystin-dependent protein